MLELKEKLNLSPALARLVEIDEECMMSRGLWKSVQEARNNFTLQSPKNAHIKLCTYLSQGDMHQITFLSPIPTTYLHSVFIGRTHGLLMVCSRSGLRLG